MSSLLEKFRVGDKVTVHRQGRGQPRGRKYVTVTPENLPARELAMRRFRQRAEVHVLPVMANHHPGETTLVTKTQVIYGV